MSFMHGLRRLLTAIALAPTLRTTRRAFVPDYSALVSFRLTTEAQATAAALKQPVAPAK